MSRKDENLWVREGEDRGKWRDAERARVNRREIQHALSSGEVSRRDLIRWGLFTSAGLLAPIGGLNPLVRSVSAATVGPTGAPPSPLFGVKAFTQAMPRFDVLARNAPSCLTPAPTAQANTTSQ